MELVHIRLRDREQIPGFLQCPGKFLSRRPALLQGLREIFTPCSCGRCCMPPNRPGCLFGPCDPRCGAGLKELLTHLPSVVQIGLAEDIQILHGCASSLCQGPVSLPLIITDCGFAGKDVPHRAAPLLPWWRRTPGPRGPASAPLLGSVSRICGSASVICGTYVTRISPIAMAIKKGHDRPDDLDEVQLRKACSHEQVTPRQAG